MKEMIIVVRDDLDPTELADRTIAFSWDGVNFEIDLCSKHLDEFAADMTRWIAVARKVKRPHKRKPAAAAPVNGQLDAKVRHRLAERDGYEQRKKIREWANRNGYKQAPTGYIKCDVLDAYYAAHPHEDRLAEGAR